MAHGRHLEPRSALQRQVNGPALPLAQTQDPSWVGGTMRERPTCPAVGLSTFLLPLGEAEVQPWGSWVGQVPKNPPSKGGCIPTLQAACRAGCGRDPGRVGGGCPACSAPPARSWEPGAGLLAPTSQSFSPSRCSLHMPTTLPRMPQAWQLFGVPCPLATPGLWLLALPVGSVMALRCRPVCACLVAAHLHPRAQPEASWDRSSRWGGAPLSVVSPAATHRCLPPASLHPPRTQGLPGPGVAGTSAQAAQDRLLLAPAPTSFDLG